MSDHENCKMEDHNIQYSAFIEGKIRWWFDLMDVDKDGHISADDFGIIAQNYVKEYGGSEDRATELQDKLISKWAGLDDDADEPEDIRLRLPLLTKLGETMKTGNQVSEDEFSSAVGQLIMESPHMARLMLHKMLSAFFDMFDHDQDGYITRSEMVVAMRCFRLEDQAVLDTAFTCMDLDKDDRLSRAEYIEGWITFLLGQDRDHDFLLAFAPTLRDL